MNKNNKGAKRLACLLLGLLLVQSTAQGALLTAYADSTDTAIVQQTGMKIGLESVKTEGSTGSFVTASFSNERADLVKIARAGVFINGSKLNFNENAYHISYANVGDCVVSGQTISFYTASLSQGSNTVAFTNPSGENVSVTLLMTRTEPQNWWEQSSYSVVLIDENISTDTDSQTSTDTQTDANTDSDTDARIDETQSSGLHVRIVGGFDNKIVGQADDVDAVSSATTGAGSYYSSGSTAHVEYALVDENTAVSDIPEDSWQKPDYFKNGDILKVNGAASKIVIEPADSGLTGEIDPFSGDLFLRGVPKKAGNYKVYVYLDTDKGSAVSNTVEFKVYSGEEKLIDQLKYDNCVQTADGKYMFDNEPWYITEFGGENETVTVPQDIKAWYGSHAALPEINYGELGRTISLTNGEEPTQTLIIPKSCDLTMVNMRIHSGVRVIVEKGAKLTLRQSTAEGIIEVRGGTFSMDYNDYGGGEWLFGSSVNGQIQMKDGSTLENARIVSHTNYSARDDENRRNFAPVVTTEGSVSIKGDVFILGDEAPSGETGQPAISVSGTLNVPKGSVLAVYGGGNSMLTANGGAAVILNNGTITGEGSLIAVGGYGMNITSDQSKGSGGAAVTGNGTLSLANAYLEGGASFQNPAAPVSGNITISDATNRKLVNGTSEQGETYWKGTGDANGIIPDTEKILALIPCNGIVSAEKNDLTIPAKLASDTVDGTYIGTGKGRNGDIKVSVVVADKKISRVTVLSQKETKRYWQKAEAMLDGFAGKTSADDVDTVSGATLSCNGIKEAVADALSKSEGTILGSGTQSDPFVISTPAQLVRFAEKVDEGDETYTKAFVSLGGDIDLNGIESWNPIGAEGKASSSKTKLFSGSFDGKGNTVSGLKITGGFDGEANLGLFSTLGGTARVSDVVITDVDINVSETGSWANVRAGGIAGDTQSASPRASVIDGCFVSGNIKVNSSDGQAFAGGILGRAFTRSAVINCAADVNASAVSSGSWNTAYAGVIAGLTGNNSVMANCSAFGSAYAENTSGSSDAYAGGLTGSMTSKTYNCCTSADVLIKQKAGVTPCYAGAVSGQLLTSYGFDLYYSSDSIVKSADDEGGEVFVSNKAWPIDGASENVSAIEISSEEISSAVFADTLSGNIKAVNDAIDDASLVLREWKLENGRAVPFGSVWVSSEIDTSIFAGGTGEENDPYLIETRSQLADFASSLSDKIDYSGKYIKLADDIDLTGETWSPIGGSFYRFNGDFDGSGKTISGLTIGSAEAAKELDGSSAYAGLFGWVNENAHIHNVTLENVSFYTHSTGSAYIGGIAGRMSGTDTEGDYHGAVIDGCTVNGVISHTTDKGTSFAGGIVGHMFKGAVINSMTDVTMNVRELSGELAEVGGIVGIINRGIAANCCAFGSVTGSAYRNTENDIEGMACIGNIAAVNGGTIVNCYGQGDVEALEYSIDTGIIAGWITGIGKAYNCWYDLDASMKIDGRTVDPVDPFGEVVPGGVSDEWGYRFPGALTDNINGYHKATDANLVADGLNASFESFPADIASFGLPLDSLRKWIVKDGKAVLSDEKAVVAYVQPDIEKTADINDEQKMFDGEWYGRSLDKSTVVKITVENSEITGTQLISGENGTESFNEAVSRARFKALFGDDSNYAPADTSVFKGSGTQSDPYLIENEEQLRYLASSVNEDVDWCGVYFRQTKNITVTGGDWKPIGRGIFGDADGDGFGQDAVALYPFKGSYDGNNYTIKGLKAGSKCAPVSANYMGLFGVVQGSYTSNEIPENGYCAELKNIRIEDAEFYAENRYRCYVGGLAANAQGGFIIDNCSVTGVVDSRSEEDFALSGGFAGSLMYGCISNSYTNTDSSAWSGKNYSYAAGMSAVTNRATIVNSYTLGDTHAGADQTNRAEAGGFIALDGGVCINCYAKGNVETVGKYSMYLGGFVGMAASSSEQRQCYYNTDASQKTAGKDAAEKRYAGKFVNESPESDDQPQSGTVMSSDAFADILNSNRNNISETLSQVRAVLGADENGSSKYHSVYFNGDESKLNKWVPDNGIVGFEKTANIELTHHKAAAPTCTKDGNIEYYEDEYGNYYADKYGKEKLDSILVPKTGHSFKVFLKWVWDGFKSAVAFFACENDNSHIETYDVPVTVKSVIDPDCTEKGYRVYTASIENDGKTYSSEKVETLDQLGHRWSEPTFNWSDDLMSASAVFICENDGSHTVTVPAEVKLVYSKEPAKETDGLKVCTAVVSFDGKQYIDSKTIIIPCLADSDVTDSDQSDISYDTDTESDTNTSETDTDITSSDTDKAESDTEDSASDTQASDPDKTTDSDQGSETDDSKDTPDSPDTPEKPEPIGSLGDVDRDGEITANDALMILRASVGMETFTPEQTRLADVDNDGEISANDALVVLRFSVGLNVNEI